MSTTSKLRDLVRTFEKVESGVVVQVTDGTVVVSGSRGLKQFPTSVATGLLRGDRVRFKGDVYLGEIRNNQQSKVYEV